MQQEDNFIKTFPLIFGFKVCLDFTEMKESTIRKYMSKKHPDRIPYWKKGGKVYFDKNEVEKWLRNGRK